MLTCFKGTLVIFKGTGTRVSIGAFQAHEASFKIRWSGKVVCSGLLRRFKEITRPPEHIILKPA